MTIFLLSAQIINAQIIIENKSKEDFETETNGTKSFTDNGVIFNIISHNAEFVIFNSSSDLLGWNGTERDEVYIDNDSSRKIESSFSIKTTSNLFKVKSFWAFIGDVYYNIQAKGSLTITGKLNGSTMFSHTKTSGFEDVITNNAGFTFIDLSNLDNYNFSNIVIDELELTLGEEFAYIAFDAFTWVKDPSTVNSDSLILTSSQTNVSCNGGANGVATINSTNGTAPYKYLWSNGAITQTIDKLSAGIYTVTVTDANNKTSEASVTIVQPTLIVSNITKNDIDNENEFGYASVSSSGGTPNYSYRWSNGQTGTTTNGLTVGEHFVITTDNNSCTIKTDFSINNNIPDPSPILIHGFTEGDTLANIKLIGENIKWYENLETAKGALNEIPVTTKLVNGKEYYVTQEVDGCVSETLIIRAVDSNIL